ncbi:MAG TPA: hypothetical protein VKD90_05360 [Gemmataceae bacterium]|nr:hypothetical protein [Gemmataceae bacterium]
MARGDLPELVRLPDGRTEPFEPERIARSLFAAGERLGRANAFLARELTDSVLHFLATPGAGPVTTPVQVAEVVGKVVRELGHPGLALAYEERSATRASARRSGVDPEPRVVPDWLNSSLPPAAIHVAIAREQLRAFSLAALVPPDLLSAHEEGLLQLTGLEHPRELDGLVTHLPPGGLLDAVTAARDVTGGLVAVDGPEFDLAPLEGHASVLAETFLRATRLAADALGLRVLLNLNIGTLPPRMAEASGPLFRAASDVSADRRREIAEALADRASEVTFDVWWHVSADGIDAPLPHGVVKRRHTFVVVDRPRDPVILGPGIDRQTPAALVRVGINLARLVEMMGGPPVDPEVFLRKVGSLTRFAKTAGHVKLDLLRRYGRPPVRAAFLLDRARLVLVPTELEVAACSTAQSPVEFARLVLRAVRTAAETDRPRVMPVRVEPTLGAEFWDAVIGPAPPVRHQVRVGSQVLAVTGAGCLDLVHPERPPFTTSEISAALRAAVKSAVTRVHFIHS